VSTTGRWCDGFLLIEEEQGGQGLVLRGGRDLALDGEVRQKRFDLGRAHRARMTPSMKQDKSTDPLQVLLLGAVAVVQRAQLVAHLLEQARGLLLLRCGRARRLIRIHAA
jgi:hypothetical protein